MNFGIALEQGETLKRQASDAGENMASKAKTAKKEVEKQSEGVMDSVLNVLNDVKDSVFGQESFFSVGKQNLSNVQSFVLETLGFASKHAADLADQAKEKLDEVSGRAQETAKKAKKDVKNTLDL